MSESSPKGSWLKIVGRSVWIYLKDWRNLVSHMALGWLLLALAIWLPVAWWLRLLIIAAVVMLNTWRMRRRSARLARQIVEPAASGVK